MYEGPNLSTSCVRGDGWTGRITRLVVVLYLLNTNNVIAQVGDVKLPVVSGSLDAAVEDNQMDSSADFDTQQSVAMDIDSMPDSMSGTQVLALCIRPLSFWSLGDLTRNHTL